MLKNHKILILIIALTTSGVFVVLGIWLNNSYKANKELGLSKAEQALMNVLYDYYSDKEVSSSQQRNHYQKKIIEEIHARYPNVEQDTLYAMLNRPRRQDSIRKKNSRQNNAFRGHTDGRSRQRSFNPWFFHNKDIVVSDLTLDSLQKEYKEELRYKGMSYINPKLNLKQNDRNQVFPQDFDWSKRIGTRPILVNPDTDTFICAEFPDIWKYILVRMVWQILFASILVLALIGTFITLFKTAGKQQKLAQLQRSFVNNMTHELKTPLSTVLAALEAIQKYGAKDDKERMNKYLDLSKREVDRLNEIVERVLTFNMDEEKGMELQMQDVDVVQILEETVASFKLSSKKDIQFEMNISATSLLANVDEWHIRNVFSNLIDNAIRYNLNEQPFVRIDVVECADSIEISIEDNGIGIPAKYQKNVFDIFFRVPNGEIYTAKGFGLGLAYVHQVLEKHKASIIVFSDGEKGTVFTIKLPR